MRSKPCLTLDDAHKMVAACRKAGAAKKMEPTVAVVDAGGHLLYLERPDRNGPNTVEMATLKARTAALRERPSSAFARRVAERPGFLAVPNCLGVRRVASRSSSRRNASAASASPASVRMTSRWPRPAPT